MSAIHPSAAKGFAKEAETYRRGRPDYPDAVDGWLRDDLGLKSGRCAVDLGAGTGKFTRRLVATGATVIAVEPVAEMLGQLKAAVPEAQPRIGNAENIPLGDETVDVVVCAQAFHWFAGEQTLQEVHRVLKPGGQLGLIWNVRGYATPWVAALTTIMAPYEADVPRYHTGRWRACFPAAGFGDLHESIFTHGHTGPPEQVIVDRILSVSFIAALPSKIQTAVADEIRALIARTPELSGRAEVTFPYETTAYRCAKQ